MKKHLLFTFLALAALIAASAARPRIPRPVRPSAPTTIATMSAPVMAPQAIGQTTTDYEAINDWKPIGQSRYTDIFCAQSDGDPSAYHTYKVETEESESHPGLFRLKNCNQNPNAYYGTPDDSQDYYLIVDATDPASVFIPLQKFGYTSYYDADVWVQSWSTGTFNQADQQITFPAWGLVWRDGETGGVSAINNPNETLFNIWLPGAKDYTMSLTSYAACSSDNNAMFDLEAGADITTIRYVFVNSADLTVEDALDQARSAQTTLSAGEGQYLAMETEGRHILAVVGYDIDGNEKITQNELYYRYDDNNDQWKSLGMTTMTENFIYSYYAPYGWGEYYGPNTYDVELQENLNTPGFYRIVNPYENNNNSEITDYQMHETDHNHYIFIHAEDPAAVTVTEAPIGCNWYYAGDMVIGTNSPGYIENGVIKMPHGSLAIRMGAEKYDSYDNFSVVIPNEHTITVKNADEAYGSVAITDPEASGNSITTTAPSVTVTATPADGAAFMNWTDADGNVLSTEATYTYVGSADFELTAHFGLSVTYTTSENGGLVVTTGGATVMSGKVYAPGTEITIRAVPSTGMQLNELTINGEPVVTDSNNEYVLNLSTSIEITAVFGVKTCTLTIITEGNGELQVWSDYVEDESADNYEAPAGTRYESGDKVELNKNINLYFYPGDGDELISFIYTIDGKDNDGMGDIYSPGYDPDILTGFITVTGNVILSAKFSGEQQGLDAIGIDPADGPVEYYNLQGIRVAEGNLVPGFYILRQGSKAVKILKRK